MSDGRQSLDDLRREIASKHHVALGADDPILILHTVNELLTRTVARDLEAAQAQALSTHRRELEVLAQRWNSNAASIGDRVLNAAAQRCSALLERASASAAASARVEFERAGIQIIRRHQLASSINLCASILTLVGSLILWLTR